MKSSQSKFSIFACFLSGLLTACFAPAAENTQPYGLEVRPSAKPFLNLPASPDGAFPRLLSETGAFKNALALAPSDSLIPYDLAVAFWSDRAVKMRWVSVPNPVDGAPAQVGFSPTGSWNFPAGTVFVKHFDLPTDETKPEARRRLETRLLVRDSAGGVFGVVYKWRADNSDAELLTTNLSEPITIQTATGVRTQSWYYPSRQDCLICHNKNAGSVLGLNTRQFNHDLLYPSGAKDNELRAWNHARIFEPPLDESGLARLPQLARADDLTRSLEDRARSYLDANCAHCHRPGGTVAFFDARYDTPLANQGLVNGAILLNQGIDNSAIVAPNDPWRSILFFRLNTLEPYKMPPLAHEELDHKSIALVRSWIESLPGPPVLPPPVITPHGGEFSKAVTVTLGDEQPGVTIHYTLDGSVPSKSDPVYESPIKLTAPATLRAKAYKTGFTRSITAQETYIIAE